MGAITEGIVNFISRAKFSEMPEETVTYAKKLILKGLAGMIAGSVTPAGKIVANYVKKQGCIKESGAVGCRFQTNMESAALINGNTGHASELEDDSFPEGCMTYNVIPSVLAVGEALRSNGREIIEAFAVGYEIQAKLALHAPGIFVVGHHTSPTTGVVGSAVGVAKLLQLSPDQIRNAMSTAATNACGLMRQTGYMCHLVECGLAAKNGVTTALWAKEGFTGDPEILEGSRGFIDTYSKGQYDYKGFVESLGNPYRIMAVGIKQYPCCYFTQRITDGVRDLQAKYKLTVDDIDVIEIYTAPYFRRLIHYPDPANGEEARFSIEHILAAVLLGEKVFLDLFTVEKAHDPKITETRKKIKTIPDPSREKDVTFMSGNDKVIVKLKNGKQHEIICKVAKGDPPNYMAESQVKGIFKDCVDYAGFLSGKNFDRVCDIVFNLEKVNDITELMNTVTFDPI